MLGKDRGTRHFHIMSIFFSSTLGPPRRPAIVVMVDFTVPEASGSSS